MIVVVASKGYPESYPKGEIITIPSTLLENTDIIHAGTKQNETGDIVSAGGRVLGAVGSGATLTEAAERAYALCDSVDFTSKFLRRDIGHKELNRT